MPMISTAKVCMVMGTGQNGTWTLAETAKSRLPATARTAARSQPVPAAADHKAETSVGWAAVGPRMLRSLVPVYP